MNELTRKPNKTKEDWERLRKAGLADFDGEHYRLNEIGMAGGFEEYEKMKEELNKRGTGPL